MIRPLVDTASNPVPHGTRVDSLNLSDGKELRYAITPASTHPVQGTVLILHGRNECIEKYFETARDIAARGFTVATFDWRGQGASSRLLRDPAKGFVKSFDDYAADLEQLFESVLLPDCRGPYYILAHSAGALTALLAAPVLSNRVRRMVLLAPLLDINGSRARKMVASIAATTLRSTGLGGTYMLGGPHEIKPFAVNEVTSDAARYLRNCEILKQAPELAIGGPTASWIVAAAKAIKEVNRPEFIEKIRIPMLIIAAGADSVVSTPAIERYALQLRNTTLLTVDGAKHEILQEKDFYREQFFATFDAFIPGTGGESL
ncbi:alpha/beta fold hydrolase [Phyllobacterium zundukense]|uniref:Lysophospholipase n=1 Tax=Phyllobacterium zundukense TaxID=1867719 RepID=A0A2N9VQB4_9HYPH|nr:alpha/beta hydrolase [Phyllobacterium zundukense]ATU90712.1 lysophospholipase [Phyllobacterium zundukense]PIO41682.1 lysophospholipase [Phyllobacterium zundukense]